VHKIQREEKDRDFTKDMDEVVHKWKAQKAEKRRRLSESAHAAIAIKNKRVLDPKQPNLLDIEWRSKMHQSIRSFTSLPEPAQEKNFEQYQGVHL